MPYYNRDPERDHDFDYHPYKGLHRGLPLGVIKGETRSLDNSSDSDWLLDPKTSQSNACLQELAATNRKRGDCT